jgi:hypothetical protein
MDIAIFVAFYLLLCAGVAAAADLTRRGPLLYLWLSIVLSPLLAGAGLGIICLVERGRGTAPARSKKRTVVSAGIIAIAVSALTPVVYEMVVYGIPTPGRLPTCESRLALKMLKDALAEGPGAQMRGLKVFDAVEPVELPALNENTRRCSALVFMNDGRKRVAFKMEWMTRAHDRWWLQVENETVY